MRRAWSKPLSLARRTLPRTLAARSAMARLVRVTSRPLPVTATTSRAWRTFSAWAPSLRLKGTGRMSAPDARSPDLRKVRRRIDPRLWSGRLRLDLRLRAPNVSYAADDRRSVSDCAGERGGMLQHAPSWARRQERVPPILHERLRASAGRVQGTVHATRRPRSRTPRCSLLSRS